MQLAKLQKVTNNTSCKTCTSCKKLRSIEASTENEAFIWLTVLPIKRNGFFLDKQAWDAIQIRYNIPLERLPTLCVCGDSFNLQHALCCPKGGLAKKCGYQAVTYTIDGGRTSKILKYEQPSNSRCVS